MPFFAFLRKSLSLFLVLSLIAPFSPFPQTSAEDEGEKGEFTPEEVSFEPEKTEESIFQSSPESDSEQEFLRELFQYPENPQEEYSSLPTITETLMAPEEITDQKSQMQKDRLEKRLQRKNLSPEKKEELLEKLQKIENQSEKTHITDIKKNLRENQEEFTRERRAELKNKKMGPEEKKELRDQKKAERKDQFDTLKEINEALKQDWEESLRAEFSGDDLQLAWEIAEANVLFELQEDTPPVPFSNDPQLSNQWSIASVLNGNPSSFAPEEGLEESEGNDPIIIALIDTGVDMTHEDLVGQFWTSESCMDDLNQPLEGGCPNGGYDFVNEDTDPSNDDNATHGTAVAGILGASTNNGIGIASFGAYGDTPVQIMVLKVAEDGFLTSTAITRAIHFAINNNADIINMSFGGPTTSAQMQEAIAEAETNNILITASAGNYGMNNDTTPIYPASYSNSNIISVAALDQNGGLASFSNYGVSSVDIAAPGVDILSTLPSDTYGTVSGTSFSAPMVAGVLGQYLFASQE